MKCFTGHSSTSMQQPPLPHSPHLHRNYMTDTSRKSTKTKAQWRARTEGRKNGGRRLIEPRCLQVKVVQLHGPQIKIVLWHSFFYAQTRGRKVLLDLCASVSFNREIIVLWYAAVAMLRRRQQISTQLSQGVTAERCDIRASDMIIF